MPARRQKKSCPRCGEDTMRDRMPLVLAWLRLVWPECSYRVCRNCRRHHVRRHDPPPHPSQRVA